MRCHIHLDLVGGIAGDMFIAALCDARPDLVDGLLQNLDSLAVPADVLFSLNVFNDGTLQGKQFATSESSPPTLISPPFVSVFERAACRSL